MFIWTWITMSFFFINYSHAASWLDPETWRYGRQTCRCSCGVPRRAQRILGGTSAEVFEYPWMAGLLYKGNLYCGGTLINDRYVLTAAHCIDGLDMKSIQVLLGDYNLETTAETEPILRGISDWVKHPKFVRRSFNNDIAVIRLDSVVSFTRSVGPVCLPDEVANETLNLDKDYGGSIAKVTGWGRTSETGPISPVLQQVDVPIFNKSDCLKTKYGQKAITENMMCAGYPEGKLDACQGDSGGPLHLTGNDKKVDLIGIVSWGQGCGRAGYPGVYTRVGRYLKWIAENTSDACYCGRRQGRGM